MCVSRGAAASRAVPVARMPASLGLLPLADVPDRQRRDGGPERVVRRKHPVIPMPVLARRRHEIGEPVEKLKRRELDDAAGPWPRGLSRAARADPVGGFVPGQHVADFGCVAACVAGHGEPLECEGGPGTLSQQVLEIPAPPAGPRRRHRVRGSHGGGIRCGSEKVPGQPVGNEHHPRAHPVSYTHLTLPTNREV